MFAIINLILQNYFFIAISLTSWSECHHKEVILLSVAFIHICTHRFSALAHYLLLSIISIWSDFSGRI